MDELTIKQRLQDIIEDYKTNYDAVRKDHMSEDDTRVKFIDRVLREVLGWKEAQIDRQKSIETKGRIKHADYSYPRVPKVIVEAKKLSVPIESGEFDKQVLDYAYSKAVNWAILTNFKKLKAWYVTRNNEIPVCNLDLINDNIDDIVKKLSIFEETNVLNGGLEKEAKSNGWYEEIDITDDLTLSLNVLRSKINKYLQTKIGKGKDEEIEELTQGIINRLIFIKKVEAENLEENKLEQIIRDKGDKGIGIYGKLKEIFAYYREKYDSDIFGDPEHKSLVEKIELDDSTTIDLLNAISRPVGSKREYNFAAIDVDILGGIYENYLTFVQKGAKLVGGKGEKKKHGIYYTPKEVVDYIVKSTLPEVAIETKQKIKKLKVIDFACGSGSFLISAMNYFDKAYSKVDANYEKLSIKEKLSMLKNNIYGVDLDEKAIAIAELNIYLNLLTNQIQKTLGQPINLLPELRTNLKIGNSIISDDNVDKKAFKWQGNFTEGSFDFVIGNPPYVDYREIVGTAWLKQHYYSAKVKEKYNLLVIFLEKGLKLLKDGGKLGFIVSSQFLSADFGYNIRELILQTCEIDQIVDVSEIKLFKKAATYPIIIILKKKKKPSEDHKVKLAIVKNRDNAFENIVFSEIDQKSFGSITKKIFVTGLTEEKFALIKRIEKDSKMLKDLVEEFTWGTSASGYGKKKIRKEDYDELPSKDKDKYIKFIQTGDIDRYAINWQGDYLDKEIFTKEKLRLFEREKIVIGRVNKFLKATLDKKKYALGKAALLIPKTEINIFYLLGILNSEFFDWYYKLIFRSAHMAGEYYEYDVRNLEIMPIRVVNDQKKEKMIALVKEILELEEKAQSINPQLSEGRRLQDEINSVNNEINKLVYKIYDITDEEKKIIEESLKGQ